MKILYVMYRFPYPLDKGDKLRAFNQIKFLSRRHEIYLCTILDEPLSNYSIEAVSPYCKKCFTFKISKPRFYMNLISNFFWNKPLQNAYVFSKSIKKKILKIIKDEGIEHAMCLMVRPAEYISEIGLPNTLDYQDVLSIGFKRRSDRFGFPKNLIYSIEADKLEKFENMLFDKFKNKIIITDEDKSFISHSKKDEIRVIGNGIDLGYFKFVPSEKNYDLLFVGNMQYEPNVISVLYLVENILPLIKKEMPDVRLMIAGADPVTKIKELACDTINVTGRLEDIRFAYRQGKIFIAPMMLGTGLQNKLLEAMAMKLPVVTSELCNKGLKGEHGKHLFVGRNPDEYAQYCIKLLKDEEIAQKIADNALQFVSEHYSWESINTKLEEIILSS